MIFLLYCSLPPSQAVFLSGIAPRSVHPTCGFPVGLQGLGFKQEFPEWPGICLSEAVLLPEELVPISEQLVNASTANSVNASVDRLRCRSHHKNSQKTALLCGQPAPRCCHSADQPQEPPCLHHELTSSTETCVGTPAVGCWQSVPHLRQPSLPDVPQSLSEALRSGGS